MVDQSPLAERDSETLIMPNRAHGVLDRGRRETIS
jgi:hypothetical protein